MNNLNPLERQLQSWIPRRPSPGLKSQLFPAQSVPAVPSPIHLPPWVKFAPAMCIVLLAMLLGFAPETKTGYLAVASGSNVLAGLSSNLTALCATDMRGQHWNVWAMPVSQATFGWTRSGHSPSTTVPFTSWNTNGPKF